MQSILQYRRFGKHVERQCQRDQATASALRREGSQSSQTLRHSPHHGDDEDSPDVEKGEGPHDGGSLAQQDTVGTHLGIALTGIEVRQRTNAEDGKVFVVGYEGEKDMMNPHNWGWWARGTAIMNVGWIAFIVGFASSIDSAALDQASEEFGVSKVVESCATGLFLVGFGCGAFFAGPCSEAVGRNPVYIATLSLYMIFVMASGLAPNIGAQLVFRLLGGFFASTPLTTAAGTVSDVFSPMERVYIFPIFANAAFTGPVLGPVVGGFIGQSSLVSWRWTEWITLIWSGLILVLILLFQPETYAPILLKWKAEHLRRLTGDSRYRAAIEVRDDTFWNRLGSALYRPFILTATEPIIVLFALYLTVVYVILFGFLNGFTYIYTETFGLSQGLTGLAFLGIAVGLCLCTLLVPLIYRWAKNDSRRIREQNPDMPDSTFPLPPEHRLWYAIFGAPAVPISLFWMGWTAYPSISPWSPIAASVLFGFGVLCIFISAYQYIIDAYEVYAASALASVTLIRYLAAGGVVIAAIPLYENLGVHWALTLFACISLLMVPVPYVLFLYGSRVRKWSKHAVT